MRCLVAYGSKMGGTRGIAEILGSALVDLGHDVVVASAKDASDVARYDAVIVGGALYYYVSWHKDARSFIKRHQAELRQRPVWFFSSGPLDDSALEKEIPPIKSVANLMERISARGHMTFGGRIETESRGLPVGDWRNEVQVRQWAVQVDSELARDVAS